MGRGLPPMLRLMLSGAIGRPRRLLRRWLMMRKQPKGVVSEALPLTTAPILQLSLALPLARDPHLPPHRSLRQHRHSGGSALKAGRAPPPPPALPTTATAFTAPGAALAAATAS